MCFEQQVFLALLFMLDMSAKQINILTLYNSVLQYTVQEKDCCTILSLAVQISKQVFEQIQL